MDSLKERVGAYLALTGKTKTKLASELGMSRTSLNSKLNGVTEFTLYEGYQLKEILGCSADEFFTSAIGESVPQVVA